MRGIPHSNHWRERSSCNSSTRPRIDLVRRRGTTLWSDPAHTILFVTWTVRDIVHRDSTQQRSLGNVLTTYLATKMSQVLETTVITITRWTLLSQERIGHRQYKPLAPQRKEWAKWVTASPIRYLDQEHTQVRDIVNLQLVLSCKESVVN